MKNFLQTCLIAITVVFATSCDKNESDPANVGRVNGFIKGTITGKTKDGTAINESFEYNYINWVEGIDNGYLNLNRTKDPEGIDGNIGLMIAFKDGNNPTFKSMTLRFTKELSASELFVFSCSLPDMSIGAVKYPFPLTENDQYNIDYTTGLSQSNGNFYFIHPLIENGHYYFKTLDGKKVNYNTSFKFANVTDSEGNVVDPGPFAGTTLYIEANDNHIEDANGNDISEIVDYNGFSNSITDYHYDETTSVVTFDFSITSPAAMNWSGHDAVISGSVQAKIYDKITSRVGHD